MPLLVGTSGWAYQEWRGTFYPDRLPQRRFLEHYAGMLTACEVNATFYRTQAESTVARWAESVPDAFRFAIKTHRRLTFRRHLESVAEDTQFVSEFNASIEPLGEKLGCLLVQFPEFVERDDNALDAVLDGLPRVPFACEFHHASWQGPAVEERVAARGGTICIREERGEALERLAPGPIGYIRLKGNRYADRQRDELLELLLREAAERPVYAFTKHKEVAPGDPHAGVGLAEWLVERGSGAVAKEPGKPSR
jgi:uncharacterized protein YecE (DUF72 family)